jgi:hypothetical protein
MVSLGAPKQGLRAAFPHAGAAEMASTSSSRVHTPRPRTCLQHHSGEGRGLEYALCSVFGLGHRLGFDPVRKVDQRLQVVGLGVKDSNII